mgnify:CR=1 FL=1
MSAFRIGFGYDVHQLKEGEEFWLGGILIPHSKGAVGHSDADVLIHVICDALLGAANLRDIGYHFTVNSLVLRILIRKMRSVMPYWAQPTLEILVIIFLIRIRNTRELTVKFYSKRSWNF